jgi:hypothetical protein
MLDINLEYKFMSNFHTRKSKISFINEPSLKRTMWQPSCSCQHENIEFIFEPTQSHLDGKPETHKSGPWLFYFIFPLQFLSI